MECDPDQQRVTWWRRDEELTWRQIENEVIILDLRHSQYIRLNASSGVLWEQLGHGATIGELAQRLVSTYDISEGRALADAEAFVASCDRNKLLRPAGQ